MHVMSRTLTEMTLVERSSLLDTVADAFEASADEAKEEGDATFVNNSLCVANTIRGMSVNLNHNNLAVAELLLEQGMMLVHAYSNRSRPKTLNKSEWESHASCRLEMRIVRIWSASTSTASFARPTPRDSARCLPPKAGSAYGNEDRKYRNIGASREFRLYINR